MAAIGKKEGRGSWRIVTTAVSTGERVEHPTREGGGCLETNYQRAAPAQRNCLWCLLLAITADLKISFVFVGSKLSR